MFLMCYSSMPIVTHRGKQGQKCMESKGRTWNLYVTSKQPSTWNIKCKVVCFIQLKIYSRIPTIPAQHSVSQAHTNWAFILFPQCTLGMWRKAGCVGGSTENMVRCYLAFLNALWSVLVVQWSWGSWKGMPHQIYLVKILVSHSQFCCTVQSASYMKDIINKCGSKAKLFRNVRQLQSQQVFWDLRLSKDEWFLTFPRTH
jgi:hypothetical protein